MGLTIEQRMRDLERSCVVLNDTLKMLHKLLKEQKGLIDDYILGKITSAGCGDGRGQGSTRPEDEIYAFVCKKRFSKIDNDLKKIRQLIEKVH